MRLMKLEQGCDLSPSANPPVELLRRGLVRGQAIVIATSLGGEMDLAVPHLWYDNVQGLTPTSDFRGRRRRKRRRRRWWWWELGGTSGAAVGAPQDLFSHVDEQGGLQRDDCFWVRLGGFAEIGTSPARRQRQ